MDNYCEQLVEKRRTGGDKFKVVLFLMLGALLASAVILFALVTGLVILLAGAVGLIVLGVRLALNVNIEYEYILTNNEMDVDKIIGKRKRKRMITADLSKAKAFTTYAADSGEDVDVTVHATSGSGEGVYSLLFEHRDYGAVRLLFDPDERMRTAITQELPKALAAKGDK